MTFFYEVYVASNNYHGTHALTYLSDSKLRPGQIVRAPLKHSMVIGLVKQPVTKPRLQIKPLEPLPLPPFPLGHLQLLEWLTEYYPAPLGSITQLFAPDTLTDKYLEKFNVSAYGNSQEAKDLPALNADQQAVMENFKWTGTNFLYGETGSGKTRIYQELATKTLADNKSAIVLSPEIGLSSQLHDGFHRLFGDRVKLFHSNLTPAERRKIWLEVLTAREPLVIIGARSALFLPLKNLGLVIIDEAHDSAYKQDQAPYYHAIRAAGKLAQLNGAPLLLGTATPNVTDYYIASQRGVQLLRLSSLAIPSKTKNIIEVVDLKDRGQFSRSSHLSEVLLNSITSSLQNKEQVLLFLNRRGTARAVICQSCGWQALCPHCDTPLIYHGDSHTLLCHVCNYRARAVSSCPNCGSTEILFRSAGTKAIVEEIRRLFPYAEVQRFDADNIKSERFEQNYQKIKSGEVDILVGTQTLAKGLDLPKLSLVGVITADSSLFIPDYLAQERTYQLISQVIGRVGRGHRDSKVIIQTYDPKSALINDVLNKNWDNFYNKELAERKKFQFPPFFYLLKLSVKRASSDAAQKSAEKIVSLIEQEFPNVVISGPAPAFHEKQGTKFEWQIVLKSKGRSSLTEIVKQLPSGWSYDIDPLNLL